MKQNSEVWCFFFKSARRVWNHLYFNLKKKCTQNPYFLRKIDFCIFKIKFNIISAKSEKKWNWKVATIVLTIDNKCPTYTVRHKISITQTLFQRLFSCTNFFRRTTTVTLVFLWSTEHIRMSFSHFAEFLRCPVYTSPYFLGLPLKSVLA